MKWIKVEDQLPECNILCLFISDNKVHSGYFVKYRSRGCQWYSTNDEDYIANVTHWMPLPEPPKK